MVATLSFDNGYFLFLAEKILLTEDVHLAVTFPKIERDM